MIEKISSWISSRRNPKYRISKEQKTRIGQYVAKLATIEYDNKVNSIFIGGSQSVYSKKYPNKFSDVDVYVICRETVKPIVKSDQMSEYSTLSLGNKMSVYVVSDKYYHETTCGMELSWKPNDIECAKIASEISKTK